ncbi:hypothetical protein BH23BAC3_BH23BAC3_01760 [soil metagenome]
MQENLTPKKAALKLLKNADDQISYEEILYEIHVLQKIERGLSDVENGHTTPHGKVEEEMKKWLK